MSRPFRTRPGFDGSRNRYQALPAALVAPGQPWSGEHETATVLCGSLRISTSSGEMPRCLRSLSRAALVASLPPPARAFLCVFLSNAYQASGLSLPLIVWDDLRSL